MKHKRTSHLEHFTLGNSVHPGYQHLSLLSSNSGQWSHPSFLTNLFNVDATGPFFFLALKATSIDIERQPHLLASLFPSFNNYSATDNLNSFNDVTFSLSKASEPFLYKSHA